MPQPVSITCIHSFDVQPQIRCEPTPYAPSESIYFVPASTDVGRFFKTVHELQQQLNKTQKRYDNVLKGLRHFERLASGKKD